MPLRRFAFHFDYLKAPTNAKRVFSDPRQMRRKRLRRRLIFVIGFFVVWAFLFFQNVRPVDPIPTMGTVVAAAGAGDFDARFDVENSGVLKTSAGSENVYCQTDRQPFAAMADNARLGRVFAHLPISLEWSHLSLEESCETISVLVPDWVTVSEEKTDFVVDIASSDTRMPAEQHIEKRGAMLEVMPRVQFDLRPVDSLFAEKIADPNKKDSLVSALTEELTALGAAGACIDYSQFPIKERAVVKPFLDQLLISFDAAGLRSCIIVEGNDTSWLDLKSTDGFDHVIVKLFYEPWVGSAPSPLSDNRWFADTARNTLQEIGSDRLVVAIGSFAAKWKTGEPVPRKLGYGEVMSELHAANATLTYNPDVSGSFASFQSEDGRRQKIWMLDVASAFNQLSELTDLGIRNIGIWSLGSEDPGLWPLLNASNMEASLNSPDVSGILLDNFIDYRGVGPALKVVEHEVYGIRSFELDVDTGRIADQTYQIYPKPYVLERYGQPAPHELILTFDDGPHPEFTAQILDTLKSTDTPAVFFVLGQSTMNAPGLLKRIYEEGHEIGAHSFTHPRMDQISASRTALEHDLSHRAIASALGRDTILYREPFLRSGGPISGHRVRPLEIVQSRGEIIYGMDVVPKDWLGLTSDEIANYVIDQVEQGVGNVILLHDGGEDRTASVEALPIIIKELNARGYVFKSIADVLGVEKTELMPEVSGAQPIFDRISFAFASSTTSGLVIVFWVVLLIGLFRSLTILSLALLRRRHKASVTGSYPKIAVVIPAFNEEAAIKKCIASILASDYPALEIVVADDGSNDNTLNEIFEFKHKRNVRVISQPNQGKWSALNRAILSLDAEIAVCIDADTQVKPDALSKLVAHFFDPKVGAVAGKIVVGNQVNLLTRMQALEYVTAQNFERRAFDSLNGILVVPGAIGAWRVSALHKAGLFCHDTMTEDADLTIAVNRAGYRVIYDECAVAYTEAPQSIRALMTQRLRWSLGMFQSAWKHKASIREGRSVGLASIPDMFVFGYLFPLLAPIADLFVVLLVYSICVGTWSGDVGTAQSLVSPELVWAYMTLPALEFAIATFAVLTDKNAKTSLILLWPFQRILYRPLLYLTVFRAVFRAMSGSLAVWGQSSRQGHDLLRLETTA